MVTVNTRKYSFTDFVQVLEHIEILERAPFIETTGAWSYYQILTHLAEHIHFSMTTFPYTYTSVLRKTVGKYLLSKILERGFMLPDGYNGQLETERIEGDDKVALLQLKSAIYSFRRFNREFAIHPLYDIMDKPTWERFHSIHIANHLSYVEIFPMQMDFNEEVDEWQAKGQNQPKPSPFLSIQSVTKLEAHDSLISKTKEKNKMKTAIRKRKR